MNEPIFLSLAEVIDIHTNQIDLYGGQSGMRDMGLLQSAIAQPQASFSGHWLHNDIFLMASAYAFHICQNHPFLDGNKRVALATALVFLELNDVSVVDPKQRLLKSILDLANGILNKADLAQVLRKLSS